MRAMARRLAALGVAALAGAACMSGDDPLVERCTEVIAYKLPSLEDIEIVAVERDLDASAVTLDFEATEPEPSQAEISSRIACDFEPSDRWALESIEIGGRALTETEVALVNSELFLRDLSRSPERLAGSSL
jgi:hypothetical protein